MNQADLIAAVAAHASLTNAGKAVEALVGTITRALKRGEEIRIAGFGTFGISERGGPQSSDRRADHDRGVEGCQVHRRQVRQGRPQRRLSWRVRPPRNAAPLRPSVDPGGPHRRPPLLKTEGPGSAQQPPVTRSSAGCP